MELSLQMIRSKDECGVCQWMRLCAYIVLTIVAGPCGFHIPAHCFEICKSYWSVIN
jgi:hypothetical protein